MNTRNDNRILTLTATVSAKDYAAFLADNSEPEGVASSFDARLNEVFGSGPEVLTTVRVKAIEVSGELDYDPTGPLYVKGVRAFVPPRNRAIVKAQKRAKQARKALKRAKRALVKFYDADNLLEDYVDACYEGEAVRIVNKSIQHMRELENTLIYVEADPYVAGTDPKGS